jgi:NADH-quinone oxidoreductase subunit L
LGENVEVGFSSGVVSLMIISSVVVFAGIGLGWWLYGRKPLQQSEQADPLQQMRPDIFGLLRHKYYIDEIYQHTIIAFNAWFARACDLLDFWLWNGLVQLVAMAVVGLSWANHFLDYYVVNGGFDEGCKGVSAGGGLLSRLQNGRVQSYLRVIGLALAVLALLLIWGWRPS